MQNLLMALRARLFVQKATVCSGGHSGHSGHSGCSGHSVVPVVPTLRSFQLCDRHSYCSFPVVWSVRSFQEYNIHITGVANSLHAAHCVIPRASPMLY
jgi:hypothetical protein